jgi:anti-sigma factor RsiW
MTVKTKLEKILFRSLRLPTCQELEEFAYDFLDGNLHPATNRKVERHLKLCAPCQRFIAAYRRVRALSPGEEPPPLDETFKEELLRFFLKP